MQDSRVFFAGMTARASTHEFVVKNFVDIRARALFTCTSQTSSDNEAFEIL